MIDHYLILQVTRNASLEVIQAAFLARTNSIQKDYANDPKKLHIMSLSLLSSYNTLSDTEKRQYHDVQLTMEDTKREITSKIKDSQPLKPIIDDKNIDIRIEPSFNPQSSLNNKFTDNKNRSSNKKNKINKLFFLTLGIIGIFLAFENSNKVIEFWKKVQAESGSIIQSFGSAGVKNDSLATKTMQINETKKTTGSSANAASSKELNERKTNKISLDSKEIVSSNKKTTDTQGIRINKESLQQLKIEQEKAQQLKIEQEKAQQLKIEQEKALALELERKQLIAQQMLRCEKARLSYNNSKNRINSVRSTYQNRINEIEKEIQYTALASLTYAFKDKRALSAGADMNRPKEELQRQIQAKMNDEVNILETELEQFKITNLECF
jgi:hypothetical protein